MLEPVQRQLLVTLATASRAVGEGERTEFLVTSSLGQRGVTVTHPGLPDETEAYAGDLRLLEADGLILVGNRMDGGAYEFDITPAGFQRVGLLQEPARQWGRWRAVDDKPFAHSAMSNVWRVADTLESSRKRYALKEMRYRKSRGSTAYQRFVREITVLAEGLKGRHANIVEVLDYALPADGDERDPYYVMPLASTSLERAAKSLRGRLEHVLEIGLSVAGALRAAHAAGIIHRDVKPGNVLLFGDEMTPVVCDFGIAYLEEADDRLTGTEAHTVGTNDFVAPELHGGGPSDAVTPAADVYSLGKTIFAAVSGGAVFPREWVSDPRFDLATRFSDLRLAHLTGLMELLVTEDRSARLQTMEDVERIIVRVLDNLRRGIPYAPGMYRSGVRPVERAARIKHVLDETRGTQRSDALRNLVDDAMSTAAALATAFAEANANTLRFQVGQPHQAGRSAATEAAEVLLSAGLPLVIGDERDTFEEWLSLILDPVERQDGLQHAADRMVLAPAGVFAAYASAAVAWEKRRLSVFRLVLDRYVAGGSRWVHHEFLGRNATAVEPWLEEGMRHSAVVQWADPPVAAEPLNFVRIVSGMAAIRFALEADDADMRAFLANPSHAEWPVPFAPGFINVGWVSDFLDAVATRPPLERAVTKDLFDITPEELRALFRRLTPVLETLHERACAQVHFVSFHRLGVDPRRWQQWCGEER